MGDVDLIMTVATKVYDWCYCIDILWWIRR